MVFRRLTDRGPPRSSATRHPTPDGTCIRDFIHVADIASAHVAAAKALAAGEVSALTANIGRGKGVSVREMVDLIREVTGLPRASRGPSRSCRARPGDPPRWSLRPTGSARSSAGGRGDAAVREMVGSAWAGWRRERGGGGGGGAGVLGSRGV